MPEPSWRAALRSLICHKLHALGPMTARELANAFGVAETAVAPRMSELASVNLVRDTGRRKSSASGKGRKQVVWYPV